MNRKKTTLKTRFLVFEVVCPNMFGMCCLIFELMMQFDEHIFHLGGLTTSKDGSGTAYFTLHEILLQIVYASIFSHFTAFFGLGAA